MKKQTAPNPAWEPEFKLDLAKATQQDFEEILEAFEKSTKALGILPSLPVETDWHIINPHLSEQLLRYNRPGSNRNPSLTTIVYYAIQMKSGLWAKTGQSIIFTEDDCLQDGQQRLWASYLGLVSFETFIVTEVPVKENLFAYMDNGRPRNGAAALQTSGLNGLSPLISQVVQIAHNFDVGAYTWQKKKRVVRMAPIQILDYVNQHKDIRKAAHLAAGEFKEASEAIGYKDIAAFVAYKIAELHNDDVCDRFMGEITLDPTLWEETSGNDGNPIRTLNKFLVKQAKTKEPLAKHLILGHVIQAFNAWVCNEPLKTIKVAMDSPFPDFLVGDKSQTDEQSE